MNISVSEPTITKPEPYQLGKDVAQAGCILFCGGLNEMLQAAAIGANETKSAAGQPVGIPSAESNETAVTLARKPDNP